MQERSALGAGGRAVRAVERHAGWLSVTARLWRAACLAILFATFGCGTLLAALIAIPILRITSGSARKRELLMQRLIAASFRMLLLLAQSMGLAQIDRQGTHRLQGGGQRLVVANHPTLIDVVLLVACMPQADCIV